MSKTITITLDVSAMDDAAAQHFEQSLNSAGREGFFVELPGLRCPITALDYKQEITRREDQPASDPHIRHVHTGEWHMELRGELAHGPEDVLAP